MKATIDIPDNLYRRVKAKTAIQGRRIRDVTVELYSRWLDEDVRQPKMAMTADAVDAWLRKSREAMRNARKGPSAREILEQDRGNRDR